MSEPEPMIEEDRGISLPDFRVLGNTAGQNVIERTDCPVVAAADRRKASAHSSRFSGDRQGTFCGYR